MFARSAISSGGPKLPSVRPNTIERRLPFRRAAAVRVEPEKTGAEMTAVRETSRSGNPSGAAKVPAVAVSPTPSRAVHVATPRPSPPNPSVGLSTNSCAVDTLTGSDHCAAAGVAATRKIRTASSARMSVQTHVPGQLLRSGGRTPIGGQPCQPLKGNCPVRGAGESRGDCKSITAWDSERGGGLFLFDYFEQK